MNIVILWKWLKKMKGKERKNCSQMILKTICLQFHYKNQQKTKHTTNRNRRIIFKIAQLQNKKYNMTPFTGKSNKNKDKQFNKAFTYKKIDFFLLFILKN